MQKDKTDYCCHQWIGVTIFWLTQVVLSLGAISTSLFPWKGDAQACVVIGLLTFFYTMVFLCALLASCTGAGSIPGEWPWDAHKPHEPGQAPIPRIVTKANGNPRFCRNTGLFYSSFDDAGDGIPRSGAVPKSTAGAVLEGDTVPSLDYGGQE